MSARAALMRRATTVVRSTGTRLSASTTAPATPPAPTTSARAARDRPQPAAAERHLEAGGVGVVAEQAAVGGDGDGVDRAGERGVAAELVARGGQGELVGGGDVGATPPPGAQVVQHAGQLRGATLTRS